MITALLKKTPKLPRQPFIKPTLTDKGFSTQYFQLVENQEEYVLYLPIPKRQKHLTHFEVKDGLIKIIIEIKFTVAGEENPFMLQTYHYYLDTNEGNFSLRYRSDNMIRDGFFFNSFFHQRVIPNDINTAMMQIHYGHDCLKLVLPKMEVS